VHDTMNYLSINWVVFMYFQRNFMR
jgi:hypothetical protein